MSFNFNGSFQSLIHFKPSSFCLTAWLIVALTMVLTACGSQQVKEQAEVSLEVQQYQLRQQARAAYKKRQQMLNAGRKLSEQERLQAMRAAIVADVAFKRGHLKEALDNYWVAAGLSHALIYIRKAASIAEKLGDIDLLQQITELWQSVEPEHQAIHEIKAYIALRQKDLAEANKQLNVMLQKSKDNAGLAIYSMEKVALKVPTEFTLKTLQTLAEQQPDRVSLWFVASKIAARLNKLQEAVQLGEKAVGTQIELIRTTIHTAELYWKLNNLQQGVVLLDAALQAYPQSRNLKIVRGRFALRGSDAALAAQYYQSIVADNDADWEAWYWLGMSHYLLNHDEQAIAAFLQVAQVNYRRQTVLYYLGVLHRDKDEQKALEYFRQVDSGEQLLRAKTNAARILVNRGDIATAVKILEKNISQLEAIDQLRIKNIQVELLIDANKLDEAKVYLDKLMQKHSGNQWVNLNQVRLALQQDSIAQVNELIAGLLTELSQPKIYQDFLLRTSALLREHEAIADAVELLSQGIEKFPDNIDLLYSRALMYEPLQDYQASEHDLRAILALEPEHPEALNALGYTLADQNIKLQEAFELISKAYELRPDNPAVIDSMGWIYYRLGDLQKAEYYLRSAAQLMDDAEVAAHLGEVLWMQGKTQEARDVWQKALQASPANKKLNKVIQRLTAE